MSGRGKRAAGRPESFTVSGRLRSIRFALRGIALVLATQHNAWLHAGATVAVVLAGLLLRLSAGEWAVVTLAIMAVWVAEALNTAFETLCDVASPAFHPSVERAKDIAAGGVLIAAVGAAVVGIIVFGPRLWAALPV